VGVYAEGGRITVKGSGAGAARTDDWLMFLAAGLRVYPGR
jgi:hypothetical protein